MNYDVIIIGAGPGGIFAAYELMRDIRLKRENVRLTGKKLRAVSIVNDVRSCAASGEQEHFLMGNIILPMISGEHCSNISGRNRQ